jgi:hypothetical protein
VGTQLLDGQTGWLKMMIPGRFEIAVKKVFAKM